MRLHLAAVLFILVLLSGSALGSVTTTTYVEYVDIWENYHGGRIFWEITGSHARILRDALATHYDYNHDGKIEMNEVVDYVREIKKFLIGQLVGTVRVEDATPLHDWYEGGARLDESDVAGLLGDLNSTSSITIKMRFSGSPTDYGNMNSMNLTLVPFWAAVNSSAVNNTFVQPSSVQRVHTEIGLTLSSYERVPGAILLRLVVGAYYRYSGPIPQDESITKVDFSIWDSPLVLFIILMISARVATNIERRMYDRNVDKGSTFGRKKKVGTLNFILKLLLVLLYVLAVFVYIRVTGLIFLSLCVVYVAIIAVVSYKLYSSPIPSVRKGILMVEDVFLLSKAGLMISHETRRLKPEVDEDVISSMLVAIQDFVRQSFKDEGNVELKRIEFGDKKIYMERGKYLILAAVMRGEMDRYVEHRLKETLEQIEKRYADILPSWKGDVEKFRGVRDMLRKIWE